MQDEISSDKIEDFLQKGGKRAVRILSILGKNLQFKNAIETPLGQELLIDLMELMEVRLEKIVNLKATEKDKSEYTAYRELTDKWVEKINAYKKGVDVIKKS